MFSLNPFNSLALVIAIVAYVGAVRLAIQQRLGPEKRKLKRLRKLHEVQQVAKGDVDAANKEIEETTGEITAAQENLATANKTLATANKTLATAKDAIKAEPEDLVSVFWRARRYASAILLLMPADITFISVAVLLIGANIWGIQANAINWGIMAGAVWLALLHGLQWIEGHEEAMPHDPTNADDEEVANEKAHRMKCAKTGPLVRRRWYWAAGIVPLALMVGLLFWPSCSDTDQTENAEAHHKSGLELYKLDRFDEAIVQHQHAIEICDCHARYHYALAKALASRNAKSSPLKALQKAIKFDGAGELAVAAKNEAAFDSIRCDAPLHELVGEPSADCDP